MNFGNITIKDLYIYWFYSILKQKLVLEIRGPWGKISQMAQLSPFPLSISYSPYVNSSNEWNFMVRRARKGTNNRNLQIICKLQDFYFWLNSVVWSYFWLSTTNGLIHKLVEMLLSRESSTIQEVNEKGKEKTNGTKSKTQVISSWMMKMKLPFLWYWSQGNPLIIFF